MNPWTKANQIHALVCKNKIKLSEDKDYLQKNPHFNSGIQ